MLDQETIRTFIRVAETESFSRAASSLHKTPAAISYRIKTLEEQVGTQLFYAPPAPSASLAPGNIYSNTAASGSTGWMPCRMSYSKSTPALNDR
jgi:Transcriptional regulator